MRYAFQFDVHSFISLNFVENLFFWLDSFAPSFVFNSMHFFLQFFFRFFFLSSSSLWRMEKHLFYASNQVFRSTFGHCSTSPKCIKINFDRWRETNFNLPIFRWFGTSVRATTTKMTNMAHNVNACHFFNLPKIQKIMERFFLLIPNRQVINERRIKREENHLHLDPECFFLFFYFRPFCLYEIKVHETWRCIRHSDWMSVILF